ncbi:hypothetical protein HYDPIDRAFT_31844 [Hydnomerulius pinastri MD-312]|uniref:Uncharacterized protein n=1 Tax=Hydnomerulius pinastri MD-312 TaxID=994086 RepID=A0A0C9W3U6_9AGAM|nr:hypothetical protein HYDPIDRAFT_31844 [Hydnomerulius pinastri MD-312]
MNPMKHIEWLDPALAKNTKTSWSVSITFEALYQFTTSTNIHDNKPTIVVNVLPSPCLQKSNDSNILDPSISDAIKLMADIFKTEVAETMSKKAFVDITWNKVRLPHHPKPRRRLLGGGGITRNNIFRGGSHRSAEMRLPVSTALPTRTPQTRGAPAPRATPRFVPPQNFNTARSNAQPNAHAEPTAGRTQASRSGPSIAMDHRWGIKQLACTRSPASSRGLRAGQDLSGVTIRTPQRRRPNVTRNSSSHSTTAMGNPENLRVRLNTSPTLSESSVLTLSTTSRMLQGMNSQLLDPSNTAMRVLAHNNSATPSRDNPRNLNATRTTLPSATTPQAEIQGALNSLTSDAVSALLINQRTTDPVSISGYTSIMQVIPLTLNAGPIIVHPATVMQGQSLSEQGFNVFDIVQDSPPSYDAATA